MCFSLVQVKLSSDLNKRPLFPIFLAPRALNTSNTVRHLLDNICKKCLNSIQMTHCIKNTGYVVPIFQDTPCMFDLYEKFSGKMIKVYGICCKVTGRNVLQFWNISVCKLDPVPVWISTSVKYVTRSQTEGTVCDIIVCLRQLNTMSIGLDSLSYKTASYVLTPFRTLLHLWLLFGEGQQNIGFFT